MLRGTASRSGGGVGAPGHGATGETGPDQVTRLTVVLEKAADAQVLVRYCRVCMCVCVCVCVFCAERRWCTRRRCFFGAGERGHTRRSRSRNTTAVLFFARHVLRLYARACSRLCGVCLRSRMVRVHSSRRGKAGGWRLKPAVERPWVLMRSRLRRM